MAAVRGEGFRPDLGSGRQSCELTVQARGAEWEPTSKESTACLLHSRVVKASQACAPRSLPLVL